MTVQDEHFLQKAHLTREQMRERIRTINPNNAKWGELLIEYRKEYLADMRSKMAQSVSKITDRIYNAINRANIQITNIKDLHEVVKLLDTFEKLSTDEISEHDIEAFTSQLDYIEPIEAAIDQIEIEDRKNELKLPTPKTGRNGQKKTPKPA